MNFVKLKIIVPGILLLLAAMPLSGFAQGYGFGDHHNSGKHGRMWDEEHMQNLENLRLLKLLETLELNQDQSDKFIAEFASFRQKMKNLAISVNAQVDSLADELSQTKPDDKEIMARVNEIEKLRGQRPLLMQELHDSVKDFLTPVQMGKLVVFEERFERELLEKVRGFRKGMPSPPDEGENDLEFKN
jgi:Spy/CpxP family protein refolding chaperone